MGVWSTDKIWEGRSDEFNTGGKLEVMLAQINKPVILQYLALHLASHYRALCVSQQCYSILPDLPDSIKAITEKRKDYSEERIIGYVVRVALLHSKPLK